MRLAKPLQPVDASWKHLPIKPRGTTKLGFSLRPRQIESFGLNVQETLEALLALPFELVRLPAYWNQIEARAGGFDTSDLERQLAAAERAGKQVILAIGAVKNFGYPEFYVPPHQLAQPLPEGSVVRPSTHADLLAGATRFIHRVVERFRDRSTIVAWQLEHESVDPLGVEHSWRLGADFVERELDALRGADPTRPVMMSGFLPTSSVVRLSQWWQTRDQGDSLAVARRLADIVGIDYYPRHALFRLGPRTVYLDGSGTIDDLRQGNKRLMVSEGQAEPWEAVTVPPNPGGRAMFSCGPAAVIRNYNAAMEWSSWTEPLEAYLFWGADYWVLRDRSGDSTYLHAVKRILTGS
ncbi:MAG TPA: hypothetical protein VGV88_02750 [Candidatus Dormibacteraeota bacterium]|nr:hypothetical protein [Candidatus Dormibacteraeota bacterium]